MHINLMRPRWYVYLMQRNSRPHVKLEARIHALWLERMYALGYNVHEEAN